MFIKKERKVYKDGPKTFIRIVEGYREDGKVKQRSIKSYGFLEDQENPEAFLAMVAEEMKTMGYHRDQDINMKIKAKDNQLNGENNIRYNYGYKYLESIYDFLDIDTFLNQYQSRIESKAEYRLAEIFKFLVFERILSPGSKRSQVQRSPYYYQKKHQFSLDDVYRSMDLLEPIWKDLQTHMRNRIHSGLIKPSETLYYDVTNYYCEIDFNDLAEGLRKRGVSKEHRLNPIVGLGLFMDHAGLPLSFQVFPGNKAETKTLEEGIKIVKEQHHIERIICVADKGLNSLPNILKLIDQKDGYIFSQMIRGPKGKRFTGPLFDDSGWINKYDEQGELVYRYKTYLDCVKLENGIEHEQRILLYWSLEEATMQKRKREEQLSRAKQSLNNNAYQIDHSFRKYIKKDTTEKATLSINYDLVAEEEKYDGFFCLVTSEVHLTPQEMRTTYANLWEIEDSFRVTKTNLEFRPIYHYKQSHIISHFVICFTSLLILRLFQYKLKQSGISLSAERIIQVLNRMNVEKTTTDIYHLESISGSKAYQALLQDKKPIVYTNRFSDEDQVAHDLKLIYLAFNVDMNLAYVKVEHFNRYLKMIRFHTTSA